MKVEQELDIRIKSQRKKEVSVMHLFCSEITQNVLSFVAMRNRQRLWGDMRGSGHEW